VSPGKVVVVVDVDVDVEVEVEVEEEVPKVPVVCEVDPEALFPHPASTRQQMAAVTAAQTDRIAVAVEPHGRLCMSGTASRAGYPARGTLAARLVCREDERS
jgi:preprotein translocase subunit SecB